MSTFSLPWVSSWLGSSSPWRQAGEVSRNPPLLLLPSSGLSFPVVRMGRCTHITFRVKHLQYPASTKPHIREQLLLAPGVQLGLSRTSLHCQLLQWFLLWAVGGLVEVLCPFTGQLLSAPLHHLFPWWILSRTQKGTAWHQCGYSLYRLVPAPLP